MKNQNKLEGFWIPFGLGVFFALWFLIDLVVLTKHKTNFTIEMVGHSADKVFGEETAHAIGAMFWILWIGISALMFSIASAFPEAKTEETK